MTIVDTDRMFSKAATVTVSFIPSTTIANPSAGGQAYICLFFPKGFFNSGTSLPASVPGYELLDITTAGSTTSFRRGSVIPAGVAFTVTISGLILGYPVGNIANSVFVTTSADTAGSDPVDSGYIGLGSYVNGSCPYGLTWDSSAQSCSS